REDVVRMALPVAELLERERRAEERGAENIVASGVVCRQHQRFEDHGVNVPAVRLVDVEEDSDVAGVSRADLRERDGLRVAPPLPVAGAHVTRRGGRAPDRADLRGMVLQRQNVRGAVWAAAASDASRETGV